MKKKRKKLKAKRSLSEGSYFMFYVLTCQFMHTNFSVVSNNRGDTIVDVVIL